MGLIVSLAYRAGERAVDIELTFTAMGCPAMEFIQDDIRERLLAEPEVDEVRIEVVWDPVWTRSRIREDAARDDAQAGDRRVTRQRDHVWEVFARQAYEEPLHHVGAVTEDDEDLALVSARAIYDEQPWMQMIIVPRAAIRRGDQRMSADGARLVASLADNKAALGRRYAEWAVSAPTLESAVAAAAMAQDELGHARSTYPVLKALGVEAEDDGVEAARGGWRCSTRSCPTGRRSSPPTCSSTASSPPSSRPAWTARVAPMAQRARKILQEEGSHRVHAEAWARRLCRAAPASARRWSRGCTRRGSRPAAGRARTTIPASARRSTRDAPPRRRRPARAGARVAHRPARRRGRLDRPRRADRLVGLGPEPRAE